MKLELKHLAGYLPYDLKVKKTRRAYPKSVTDVTLSVKELYYSNLSDLKPYLRPLSSLTKEITVNGETFVPMVKMAQGLHKATLKDFQIIDNGAAFGVICDWGLNLPETKLTYFYDSRAFCCEVRGLKVDLYNQDSLFEQLYEWHFDKDSLIDAGLAEPLID